MGRVILSDERDRLSRHMLDALMAGNAQRASGVAGEAFDAGLTLTDLFDDVLAPALCAVGERWQGGLVRHTQEQFATTAAEALLDRIAPRARRERRTRGGSWPAWTASSTAWACAWPWPRWSTRGCRRGRSSAPPRTRWWPPARRGGRVPVVLGPVERGRRTQRRRPDRGHRDPRAAGRRRVVRLEQPPLVRLVGSMAELASMARARDRAASL